MEKENLDLCGHIASLSTNQMRLCLPSYRCYEDMVVVHQRERGSALITRDGHVQKEMVLRQVTTKTVFIWKEDLLWLNMISAGARLEMWDQILCKVRVGAGDVFERRGGLSLSQTPIAKQRQSNARAWT